jgi:hypothetical protein
MSLGPNIGGDLEQGCEKRWRGSGGSRHLPGSDFHKVVIPANVPAGVTAPAAGR